jgi:hypothetical protein
MDGQLRHSAASIIAHDAFAIYLSPSFNEDFAAKPVGGLDEQGSRAGMNSSLLQTCMSFVMMNRPQLAV